MAVTSGYGTCPIRWMISRSLKKGGFAPCALGMRFNVMRCEMMLNDVECCDMMRCDVM